MKKTLWEQLFGFFCESDGTSSSTRLIFVSGCYYAMFMGAWVFYETKSYMAMIATVTGTSTVFIGGKLIQKSQESKPDEGTKS